MDNADYDYLLCPNLSWKKRLNKKATGRTKPSVGGDERPSGRGELGTYTYAKAIK